MAIDDPYCLNPKCRRLLPRIEDTYCEVCRWMGVWWAAVGAVGGFCLGLACLLLYIYLQRKGLLV